MKVVDLKHCLVYITLFTIALCGVTGCRRTSDENRITLYSGRNQHLLAPLLTQFTEETGIAVHTRYGGTAELAATILEEGERSPADVFFAQDAGALGALSNAGFFQTLPENMLAKVPEPYRSQEGLWVGTSGRARVLVYNTNQVEESALPADIDGLTDAQWRNRVGWAPMNASFQAFVTALRVSRGETATKEWLEAMAANQPRSYPRNTAILQAVAAGEIDIGLSNHYYLYTMEKEQGTTLAAKNYIPPKGTLVNVAGVGILRTSRKPEQAQKLVQFLLSKQAQRFFTDQTFEYPLVKTIEPNPVLPPLDAMPGLELDLSLLEDLSGTLPLLQELGIL